VSEYERASRRALEPEKKTFPLYGDRPPVLLLPIALDNGSAEDAALLTVPLIRRRSAASVEASAGCRSGAVDLGNPGEGVLR